MPKGHNKGFQHYMGKKFFHPTNPHNLEKVAIAKRKQERSPISNNIELAIAREEEKKREYAAEQERWEARAALSTSQDKAKQSLSFMYDLPPGHAKRRHLAAESGSSKSAGKSDVEYKFEWQRNAPREPGARGDPNIIDQPFGVHVQMAKCIRCQVRGHTHTEKVCPKYGMSRDTEEVGVVMDDKQLIMEMNRNDKLRFNSHGVWDNGKSNGKQYDLLFSPEDIEEDDIMVNLLNDIRSSSKQKAKRSGKRSQSPSTSSTSSRSSSSSTSSSSSSKSSSSKSDRSSSPPKRRKKARNPENVPKQRGKPAKKSATEEKTKRGRSGSKSTSSEKKRSKATPKDPKNGIVMTESYLEKVDDILFGDIGLKSQKKLKEKSTTKGSSSINQPNRIVVVKKRKLPDHDLKEDDDIQIKEDLDREDDIPSHNPIINQKEDGRQLPTEPEKDSSEQPLIDSSPRQSASAACGEADKNVSMGQSLPASDPSCRLLSEVDRILKETESTGEESDHPVPKADRAQGPRLPALGSNSPQQSSSEVKSDRILDRDERRLLDLIHLNQIDVKKNFLQEYNNDPLCHFCRMEEDTEHLAACPVYDGIMRGKEFRDLKSKNVQKVKRALFNIRQALEKRAKALSVTSLGRASEKNMAFLDSRFGQDLVEEKKKKILEIIQDSTQSGSGR